MQTLKPQVECVGKASSDLSACVPRTLWPTIISRLVFGISWATAIERRQFGLRGVIVAEDRPTRSQLWRWLSELGILYSDRGDSVESIRALIRKRLMRVLNWKEAHYRLAQAYNRAGEKSEAQGELQLYKQLSKKGEEEAERERRRDSAVCVHAARPVSTVSPLWRQPRRHRASGPRAGCWCY